MIAAAEEFEDRKNMTLREITVDKNHKWKGKMFKPYPYAGGNFDRYDTKGKRNCDPYRKYSGV